MNLRNKLKWFGAVAIVLGFASCGSDKTEDGLDINFTISGKIDGASDQTIYIEAVSQDGTIDVAKGDLSSSGDFEIEGNIPGMGIYQMRLGESQDKIIPLTLEPNDAVVITSKFDEFSTRPVYKGTDWASTLTKYMSKFADFTEKQKGLTSLQQSGMSEEDLMKEYFKFRAPLDKFAKQQMEADPSNPVNIILSSSLSPSGGFPNWDPSHLETLKKVSTAFTKKYSNSPISETLSNQVFQIENGYKSYLESEKVGQSNAIAPEISMNTPEGKILKLSDLRGKYVLIDFWASWCGPCRRENPNVVRLYNLYKDKGFTVFSVSLDKDANAWKEAIAVDGLVWPYHVSDLMMWDTPMVQLYGFNGIPHTVLIDKQGTIIAKNLRGASLEQKLKEIL